MIANVSDNEKRERELDTFLVKLIGIIEKQQRLIRKSPVLDSEVLNLDYLPLILDLLGVPKNNLTVDEVGCATTEPDTYCRDFFWEELRLSALSAESLRMFVNTIRREAAEPKFGEDALVDY